MTTRSFGPFPVFERFTPNALTQFVSNYREWAKPNHDQLPPTFDFAAISDKGIEDLVSMCYSASLLPEEGRYPRFSVVVAGRHRPANLVTRFNPSIRLDASVLRRLAPAIPENFAISIREESTGLQCEGIAKNLWEKDFLFDTTWEAGISRIARERLPLQNGMCIRVVAPGEMTIAEEFLTYRTRGGRAWPEPGVSFTIGPGVYQWLCELTAWIGQRLSNPKASGFYEADCHGVVSNWLIDVLWERILCIARNLGHGAAFVIRPAGHLDGIKLKYPSTGLHLGEELVSFLNALAVSPGAISSGRYSLFITLATSLAHLSAVDGCVVLDRNLRLDGFAGHIQVDDDYLRNNARTFADDAGRPRSEDELLAGVGARHQSAFRLCKAYPNHLVFLISQDGDMRVFSSDAQHVYESRISADPRSLLSW